MASLTGSSRAPPDPANTRLRHLVILAALPLAACNPEPADTPAVTRIALDQAGLEATDQRYSPDTTGAAWLAVDAQRIAFALPGKPPWLSLSCEQASAIAPPQFRIIRHAPADPHAKAFFALIGNGRIARLKLDAIKAGAGWRWEGVVAAQDPVLDVLDGSNSLEGTLPGAGTLKLNASGLPRDLLAACRRLAPPD